MQYFGKGQIKKFGIKFLVAALPILSEKNPKKFKDILSNHKLKDSHHDRYTMEYLMHQMSEQAQNRASNL